MKLATYTIGDKEIAGAVLENQVVDLSPDIKTLFALTPGEIGEMIDSGERHSLNDVRLRAPVPKPEKVICIGLNYRKHAKEAGLSDEDIANLKPFPFLKPPSTTIIGPGDDVALSSRFSKYDWEVELAVIIGKEGKYVDKDIALDHVAGYSVFIDVSCREIQIRDGDGATPLNLVGIKCMDTFAPMGPSIATKDDIKDPHDLNISMKVNGEIKQDSSTSELITRVPELIEYLSSIFTLRVGDVIATGTPSGVGMATNTYLKHGDVMEAYIEGIGILRNGVVNEKVLM